MDTWFLKFSSNFIDMILVRHCPATSCLDTSGYVGTQQDWQEHWNWGGESDFTSDQYYGNVAFFVPFQGMAGVAGDSSMTATAASTGQGTSKTEGGESSQSLQEIAQKMAKLQAENQRLMHLCEVERRMRQIEVTAFQQTLEMYAVPHSEVDQLVRRFQEDGPTALYDGTNQYGLYSNAAATGATGSGTGTTAVSLESLLQDLYKKLYEPKESKDVEKENDNSDTKDMKDTEEWGANDTWEASRYSAEIEEVEQYLCHLESMVEMTIDERARTTLLSMTPEQGKVALAKVEEIIREQGGYCRSLSSMVQSVCRKTGHAAKQWAPASPVIRSTSQYSHTFGDCWTIT